MLILTSSRENYQENDFFFRGNIMGNELELTRNLPRVDYYFHRSSEARLRIEGVWL